MRHEMKENISSGLNEFMSGGLVEVHVGNRDPHMSEPSISKQTFISQLGSVMQYFYW